MSTKKTGEAKQLLTFPSASSYVGFLLTCLEEPAFRQGSVIYEERLNRIYVRKRPQTLNIAALGDPRLIRQLSHMAVANGGTVDSLRSLEKSKYYDKPFTVEEILKSVRLHQVDTEGTRFNHLLVALYGADANSISSLLRRMWDLGARGVELAFIGEDGGSGNPTHLVRMFGIRHADAFRAWCRAESKHVEVYTPLRTDRRDSRFYCLWGYRHPIPTLDQLVERDRELVLLRSRSKEKPGATEWITFKQGSVNFFRKAFEFTDLQLDLQQQPLVELEEDRSQNRVPLELALVRKPKTGPNRIWQLDKQIDRQRRELQNLEVTRARLASGEHEEVYFAYRFDQPGKRRLNSRLIRLLQQRVGTLSHYEYAYCQPERGKPFHLVISNRSQRQLGFSLQPADRVYYQPAGWRQWGVNLFVPLNTELAPRIDVNDALPILQQFMEQAQEVGDSEEIVDAAAVLWEQGSNGTICETRIEQSAPLLSQFRLLNSFQRDIAQLVDEETQRELLESLHGARQRMDQQLDDLTRDLLGHVGTRVEKLQASYKEMRETVQAAAQLLSKLEPRVLRVREVVLELPDQWIQFVNRVIDLHREIATPEIAAAMEFREQLNVNRQNLRALATRNRDLSQSVAKHSDDFSDELASLDEVLDEGISNQNGVEDLLERASEVFQEIASMHSQISDRIAHVKSVEAKADEMQEEIDEIDERQSAVEKRMQQLVPLHEAYQEKLTEVDRSAKQLDTKEQTLAKRTSELAKRRAELNERLLQAANQMKSIEKQLAEYSRSEKRLNASVEILDDQLMLVDTHSQALQMWDQEEQNWKNYIVDRHDDAERQLQQLHASVAQLEAEDADSDTIRVHMDKAREHLGRAEELSRRSRT